jgi:hypothetical protein
MDGDEKLAGGLVALIEISLERLFADDVQHPGGLGAVPRGYLDGRIGDRRQRELFCFPEEEIPAREHLPQEDAGGEHIAARIQRLTAHLFR